MTDANVSWSDNISIDANYNLIDTYGNPLIVGKSYFIGTDKSSSIFRGIKGTVGEIGDKDVKYAMFDVGGVDLIKKNGKYVPCETFRLNLGMEFIF